MIFCAVIPQNLSTAASPTFAGLTINGIGTFNEVNIGAIGSAGTILAAGTANTTETYPGLVEIVSSSGSPISTALASGINVSTFFNPNPSNSYNFAGSFFNLTTGNYTTFEKNFIGLYGGANTELELTSTVSGRNFRNYGLYFTVYNNANMEKSGVTISTIELYGIYIRSSFGYLNKTISGTKLLEKTHGIYIDSVITGIYNATNSGENYGQKIIVADELDNASTGNITSYGLHLTIPATNTKGGGGVLTSWGIYEASQVNNALYGNTRIGSVVAPTVALDVTGAGLISSTLGVTGLSNCNMKCAMTPEGGFAVRLTNKTGGNSVKGQLVKADTATDDAVILTVASDDECFGVFFEDGIADGEEIWVVVSGIADVAMEDNTAATHGNWVYTSTSEAGYADATQAAPLGAPSHFNEIGHCIETVAAGGAGTHIMARCILHFN